MCVAIGFVNWKSFMKNTPPSSSSIVAHTETTLWLWNLWVWEFCFISFSVVYLSAAAYSMSAHAERVESCSVTQASCCDAEPPPWFMSHQWLLVNHSSQTFKSAKQRHIVIPAKSSSILIKLSSERHPAARNTKKMPKWHAQTKKKIVSGRAVRCAVLSSSHRQRK